MRGITVLNFSLGKCSSISRTTSLPRIVPGVVFGDYHSEERELWIQPITHQADSIEEVLHA